MIMSGFTKVEMSGIKYAIMSRNRRHYGRKGHSNDKQAGDEAV